MKRQCGDRLQTKKNRKAIRMWNQKVITEIEIELEEEREMRKNRSRKWREDREEYNEKIERETSQ